MTSSDTIDDVGEGATLVGSAEASPRDGGAERVVVLSFNYEPPRRVVEFVNTIVDQGADVDLFVLDPRSWRESDVDTRARLHAPTVTEDRHPLRRVEWILLVRGPGAVLGWVRRRTARTWIGRPVAVTERVYLRVANAVHSKVYMRGYQLLRPYVLVRIFRKPLRTVDGSRVDRIVAADIYAVTLGYRLARRHPEATATTALKA